MLLRRKLNLLRISERGFMVIRQSYKIQLSGCDVLSNHVFKTNRRHFRLSQVNSFKTPSDHLPKMTHNPQNYLVISSEQSGRANLHRAKTKTKPQCFSACSLIYITKCTIFIRQQSTPKGLVIKAILLPLNFPLFLD